MLASLQFQTQVNQMELNLSRDNFRASASHERENAGKKQLNIITYSKEIEDISGIQQTDLEAFEHLAGIDLHSNRERRVGQHHYARQQLTTSHLGQRTGENKKFFDRCFQNNYQGALTQKASEWNQQMYKIYYGNKKSK